MRHHQADTLAAVNSQLANFAVSHRLVIPTGATDRACWLVDYLTGVGAPEPVVVAVADGRRSRGATYHLVPRTGDQPWQVVLRHALTRPDDDLAATLDAIDPLHEALVLAPPILDTSPRLLGRRAYGWRRAAWARYEDKIVSNAIWSALDVHWIPAAVCPPTVAGVTDAWLSFGRGPIVVSSDASHGYHSGGNGVRWAATEDQISRAVSAFTSTATVVRVSPYVDGIACTVHGIVIDVGVGAEVAVFEPMEDIVAWSAGGEVSWLGTSTLWRIPDAGVREIRRVARLVGEYLHGESGYLGPFNVDGVLAGESFRPTEINARLAAPLRDGVPVDTLPLGLLAAMATESDPLGVSATDLERLVRSGLRRMPAARVTTSVPRHVAGGRREVRLCERGGTFGRCPADTEPLAIVDVLPTPFGTTFAVHFARTDDRQHAPLGPLARRVVDYVRREL